VRSQAEPGNEGSEYSAVALSSSGWQHNLLHFFFNSSY
jgi:hypothetical protein